MVSREGVAVLPVGISVKNRFSVYKPVVLKRVFSADPFHCTQNCCGAVRFINVFSIIERFHLVVSWREYLNRPGNTHLSGSGESRLKKVGGTAGPRKK